MKTPETETVFAGVDDRLANDLPTWYDRQHGGDDVTTFAEAIRDLPRGVASAIAYENPYTGEWVETDRFSAIVEPSRLAAQARGEQVDPLFHVPSDSYTIINPVDVYGPLEELLCEVEIDGRALGDIVFGQIRQYRSGGEVHMDVLFDGLDVELPGRDEPITMGISSGYDYFGGHAVYVEGFAQDTYCANSMRSLTDRETIKHVGDIGDFREWWEAILEQLGFVADDLLGFIEDALDITVDFTSVPFDPEEFYGLLGFPDYLATRAASDARAEADDPFKIDMWTLHSGATHALTHFFTGKEGVALDGYVRTANDILFNPEAAIGLVEREFEQQASAETSANGQTGLESQVALAQIERVSQDIRERADQFEEREAEFKTRFEVEMG